jgi:hypothetical protein
LSVFAAYKAELAKQVSAAGYIQQQPGWVAKLVNASNAAWRAAATPLHIKNGWARSGIFATPEQRAQLFAEWTRGGVNATKEPRALPQPGQLQEVRERLAEYQQQLRDFELKTVLPRHVPRPPLAHRPRGPSAAQPINTELTSADVLAGIRNAATAKAAKAEARRAGVVRPRGRPRKLRPASADSDASAPAVPAPRKRAAASASAPSSDDEDSGGADSLESQGDLFRPSSQRKSNDPDFIYYWYARGARISHCHSCRVAAERGGRGPHYRHFCVFDEKFRSLAPPPCAFRPASRSVRAHVGSVRTRCT